MAFLLKAMGFGDSIPGFPFTALPDAKETAITLSTSAPMPWTLREGKNDEDSKPVTIFSVSLDSCGTTEAKALARNALTMAKRLRLPGVLRCYGAAEHSGTLYFATERCEPLTVVLADHKRWLHYYGGNDENPRTAAGPSSSPCAVASKQLFEEGVALGLKTIGNALTVIHKNDLFHGNVCAESVFVTESGFWRLCGFEFTSPCASGASFATVAPRYIPPCRAPHQLLDRLAGGTDADPRVVDCYGLGCLIYESLVLTQRSAPYNAMNVRNLQLQDVRQGKSALPPSLQQPFLRMTETSPTTPYTVEQFVVNCAFIDESDYVHSMEELDELTLWEQGRRDSFMERLTKGIPTFPRKACLAVILPKLIENTRIGTATASAVAPVLAIAQRVSDEQEFNTTVTPALVALYKSPDRITRCHLLQQVNLYSSRISAKALNEMLWPLFIKGFTSPAAAIREHTARALVPLAPKLSAHAMLHDVPRLLQALQQDADGTIRANATICLCLVADYIPDANDQRAKVLVVGFGRMLKDAYLPSKMAALNSLSAVLHHVPAKIMADMVMPGVAPITMDTVAEARQAALGILKKALVALEANDSAMKAAVAATEAVPASTQQQQQASPPSAKEGWGFGLWGTGTPSPAPSTQSSSPSPGSPKHGDPVQLSGGGAAAVHQQKRGLQVIPTTATGATAVPLKQQQHAPVKSGWSDDEDGWDAAPTTTTTATTTSTTTTTAARKLSTLTTKQTAAAGVAPRQAEQQQQQPKKVSSGWSDDEDADGDDWGAAPTTKVIPHARPSAGLTPAGAGRGGLATASGSIKTLPSASSGMSLSSKGTEDAAKMHHRRKIGGLGGARIE